MFSQRYTNEENEQVKIQVTLVDEAYKRYRVTVGDDVYEFAADLFQRAAFAKQGSDVLLQVDGREYRITETGNARTPDTAPGNLQAPMAGKVIEILVQPGDEVKAGDALVTLESMKMEQKIVAPHDGVIDRILCEIDGQVEAGAKLIEMRETADASTNGSA